ncbi:hypothetical protein C1N50_15260 [Vibrio campbellii]|nr:hypothetical protein C1N50_15260 [Vibrio campbellii]
MKVKIQLSLIIALLFFINFRPIFLFDNIIFLSSVIAILLVISLVFFSSCKIQKNENISFYIFFFSLLILYFLMYYPIREFDSFSPFFVLSFVMLAILLIYPESFRDSYWYSRKIMILVCCLSCVSLVLFGIGLPFPDLLTFSSLDNGLTYKMYYLSFYATNQEYSIAGFSLYRNSAWFAEPGHFALLLSFFLFFEVLYSENRKIELLFLISLLTTLSSAGLIGFFLYLSYKIMKNIKKGNSRYVYIFLLVVFVFSVLYYFNFLDQILEKFVSLNIIDVLNNRAVNPVTMDDIYKGNVLIGEGRNAIEEFGFRASDFRVYIYKYGFMSLFLFFICNFIILAESITKKMLIDAVLFVLLIFVVFLHRTWMVDKPYFIYIFSVFFLLMISDKYEREHS